MTKTNVNENTLLNSIPVWKWEIKLEKYLELQLKFHTESIISILNKDTTDEEKIKEIKNEIENFNKKYPTKMAYEHLILTNMMVIYFYTVKEFKEKVITIEVRSLEKIRIKDNRLACDLVKELKAVKVENHNDFLNFVNN